MKYTSDGSHGTMFHHFHGGNHLPVQGSISADEFEAILQYVGIDRFLSPEEWLHRFEQGQLSPHHLCITFDDGLRCQYDVALPILEKYGLTAFWFVYSAVFEGQFPKLELYRLFRTRCFANLSIFYRDFFQQIEKSQFARVAETKITQEMINTVIEQHPFYSEEDVRFRLLRDRVLGPESYEHIMDKMVSEKNISLREFAVDLWMTNDHLSYLDRSGHHIGLHSYSHPTMVAQLSFERQQEEYQSNLAHLRRVCGRMPVAMSHPCNSYNKDTLTILDRLGIRCGFRANMVSQEGVLGLGQARFEVARQDHANIIRMIKGDAYEAE